MTGRARGYAPTTYDEYDVGLKTFLSSVLGLMAVGLAITGALSWFISHNDGMMHSLFHATSYVEDGKTKTGFAASGWWWGAAGLQLAIVIALTWTGLMWRISLATGAAIFAVFAALNGVTLAPVLYEYTDASVVKVFFITATMFGGSALFGRLTKIRLTRFSGFILPALIGLLVVLLVSAFIQSTMMDIVVSVSAVILFSALTAFDIQKLEEMYDQHGQTDGLVVYGALTLYLDFMNMLLHLLRLFGIKKD